MLDSRIWQQHLGKLAQGEGALNLVGMPRSHAAAFARIAQQERCVISSRELGKVGTGLVEEGYDSKGFRIKSKTCNFGPMAGFVCVNPNYSKKGTAYAPKQQQDINHALQDDDHVGWRATTEQICISDARLAWLTKEKSVKVAPQPSTDNTMVWGYIKEPAEVHWVAKKMPHRLTGEQVWHLYEAPNKAVFRGAFKVIEASLSPMRALVNPHPAYPLGHYKNCVCGDYDLFAVWPYWKNYSPMGEDRRIAGMLPGVSAAAAAARNAQIIRHEDARLGNISNRVHLIAQLINSVLPPAADAIGGRRDMVHHSDEAGRPFVSEVELPVIAFIPSPQGVLTVGASNVMQIKALMMLASALDYQVIINQGWKAQLGLVGANLGQTGDARGWQPRANDPGRAR